MIKVLSVESLCKYCTLFTYFGWNFISVSPLHLSALFVFIFFFSLYSQSTKICLMLPPYNLEIPGILCHNLYWCCLKFHVLPAKSNSYKTEVSSTLHCLVFFFCLFSDRFVYYSRNVQKAQGWCIVVPFSFPEKS